MVYVENMKEMMKNFLELSDHSKIIDFKGIISKSTAFLHTSNKKVECKVENTMLFTIEPSKMKYMCINLTNYVQNIYGKL